jgi:hypothetical protein
VKLACGMLCFHPATLLLLSPRTPAELGTPVFNALTLEFMKLRLVGGDANSIVKKNSAASQPDGYITTEAGHLTVPQPPDSCSTFTLSVPQSAD